MVIVKEMYIKSQFYMPKLGGKVVTECLITALD